MMKFMEPELEVIHFCIEDVISTSMDEDELPIVPANL